MNQPVKLVKHLLLAAYCAVGIFPAGDLARAHEEPGHRANSAAEWSKELRNVFSKLDGFSASYRSGDVHSRYDCTLGVDFSSGIAALRIVKMDSDVKKEIRIWKTSEDMLYMQSDDENLVFKDMDKELRGLNALGSNLSFWAKSGLRVVEEFQPGFYLKDKRMEIIIQNVSKGVPFWYRDLDDSQIKEFDEKSVTFTSEHGLITVSRENGMLIRQSVTSENGNDHLLELTDLKINPGSGVIERMSSGWSGDGARDLASSDYMLPLWLKMFQHVIDNVDRNDADLVKLEEVLGEQCEALRQFADRCIFKNECSHASIESWNELFNRDKIRQKWPTLDPDAKVGDEKAFEKFLATPEFRNKYRQGLVQGFLSIKAANVVVMRETFGRTETTRLKANTEAGKAAIQMIEEAVIRAYAEALADRKMAEIWGERDGLD